MEINSNIILRQYKLHKLGIPIDSKFRPLISFVAEKFDGLYEFDKTYQERKYSQINKTSYDELIIHGFFVNAQHECVVAYDYDQKYFYVKKEEFWDKLQNFYLHNYPAGQIVLQKILTYILNLPCEGTYTNIYEYEMNSMEQKAKKFNSQDI